MKKYKYYKTILISLSSLALVLVLINIQPLVIAIAMNESTAKLSVEEQNEVMAMVEKELAVLEKKIAANTPQKNYIVINSTANEFYLYKGARLIKKDICSTGSYIKLKQGENKKWIFKTPKGEFKILNKTVNPVWKKPDWAFVEEGLKVPSPNHPSRFEYGVLGDYSLSIGDGYLLHGTLYQRFLGLPVTHGCVRLNDENLELIYKSLPIGSKVYIF
ncbi:MAG: L,D-transpeptidase [Cytophagales bacterium CG12_big_fil_rev_8_21_14_0_65_40_12]|nr:MAG: L,D-transpeptidase [Cytophagales bacterium CG12_big_fil_rev_8_21_14_0_65_40_12]PIW06062.1 MAG: L,D-transpeptidase [Cytophagales bacterium CG17_big_fil_post_rev_8_21_14_2_50_40_13]